MSERGSLESRTEQRGWGKQVCLRTAEFGLAGMGQVREEGQEVRPGSQEGQPTTGLLRYQGEWALSLGQWGATGGF